MVQQAKIDAVQKLKEKLGVARSLVLVDFTNLSVNLQNKLRQAVVNSGGHFGIVKNTLLKLAFKETKPEMAQNEAVINLNGPTAALFGLKDELEPLKALAKFIEENELPQIKFGFFEDKIVTLAQIQALAKLPGRQELLGQTVMLINSPLSGLAYNLQFNLNQLAWTLTNIKNKNSSSS